MLKHPILAASLAAATAVASAAPLTLEVFNPGEAAIFPVASTLVMGERDAVLIDAQFSVLEAQKLVERIRASGKRLHTVYISHGDPDFYFGLEVVRAAFPDARLVATSATLAAMHKKAEAKLAYWGPILKTAAPKAIVYPQALTGDSIELEGQQLRISGPQPERSYVWIPSIKAIVGGVALFNNLHVWVADTQSVEARDQWRATLDSMAALQPLTVVAGHYAPAGGSGLASIGFTRDYLAKFEAQAAKAKDSGELIASMRALYPQAGLQAALATSAKVIKGEINW
jgi:glyoxylase-like metal-dependent hydrolase (beta-lactamase superfamily II)